MGRAPGRAPIGALLLASTALVGTSVAADHGTDGAALAARRVHAARARAGQSSEAVIEAQARIARLSIDVAAAEHRLAEVRRRVAEAEPTLGDLVVAGASTLVTLIDDRSGDDVEVEDMPVDAVPADGAPNDDGSNGVVPVEGALIPVSPAPEPPQISPGSTPPDDADLQVVDDDVADREEDLAGDLEFAEREIQALKDVVEAARNDVLALVADADDAFAKLAEVEAHHLPDPAIEAELARLELEHSGTDGSERAANAVAAVAARAATIHEPEPAPADRAMLCPLDGEHTFVNTFGAPRSGGRRHQGVDMMSASGTPIVAVESGSVNFKTNRLGGRAIWLTGITGTTYYYAHLRDWEGSSRTVTQGEVIGYVGTTGNAYTPHLHFEIHPGGGSAISPFSRVDEAC
ncbi:MAG: M23 family metallopeptidase [Ilumatobacter sp.]|nr:M23 family metallopeptidase [Ilumatobacter sp.]